MIVIYSENFLEELRRPSNIVTIGSYTLDNIPISEVSVNTVEEFSERVLNATPTNSIEGDSLIGFWEYTKHIFKLRMDLPEKFIANPQSRQVTYNSLTNYELGDIFQYNAIRFYEDNDNKDVAFAIINDTRMSILNDLICQTRNLFNIQLPEDSTATLRTLVENKDLKFLGSYGVDLGENAFKVDKSGNIMITKDSFYKLFTLKDSEMDVEAIPYVRNDAPYTDVLGKKNSNDYTYKIYKNLKINCSGLEHDCWIPTKYNLYRNYLDGGIKIYGTADYDEYRVFGNAVNRIASGTDTIDHIPGIEFVEITNTGLTYKINYNKQKFVYTKPDGNEDSINMNAAVILKAVLRNSDKTEIESEKIRFFQGGREDEWRIFTKSTEYFEVVNKEKIPVFLFQYNAGQYYTTKKSRRKDLYSHNLVISTSINIKKKEDVKLHFDDNILSKYFEVDWKLKHEYDELDPSIFKKTLIYVTLRAKKINTDQVKWWPLNSKNESTLILTTIKYDRFESHFYMVQGPRVKGLGLYEFNPIGSSFTQINKIEFSPIEKEKIYWMLTEENEIPKYQTWWKVNEIKEGSINSDLGIAIGSEEYLGRNTYTTKKEDEIIRRENKGKFSEFSKMAMRADVEVGTNTSSYFLKPDDEEIFTKNKYMTILDEFSIDNAGFITLGTSKVVSQDGIVQYDYNKNLTSKIGGSFVDLNSTPITKSVTTYINNAGKSTVSSKKMAESSRAANIKKNTAYTMTNSQVPKAISTTAATDSRLINNELSLGQGASKYWVSDSTVLGQFVNDTKNAKATDVISTVGSAMLGDEYKSNRFFDSREKQDTVISFIAGDGSIKYTSKEEGISVKVVTDDEGKLVKEPRKIWDNLKLRPVIIKFEKSPKDVNAINGEPITFYRVSEEELELDFTNETWRNMVTRAQVTYEVLKNGQEPFIQIIEKLKNDDVKAWRFRDGRLERYIRRGSSLSIDTSYINRKSFLVRSNCPFKLTFNYNSGFENTLAFDKSTNHMSQYTISNDSQTLYSKKYNSIYGQGIFMNVLEADDTGTIGKITATYNDYTTETTVESSSFSNLDTATLVDKDGNIDKNAISQLVLVNRGLAKNIFAYSRRTLHHMFTSFTDVEDVENLKTINSKDNIRNSLIFKSKTQHLRVSAANPYFDEEGYINHKITLDIERTTGRAPTFPISPMGQLSVLPFNKTHSYSRNSSKGVQYYIYENGINPKLTMQSNPGVLGGKGINVDDDSQERYKAATIAGTKYSLAPWGTEDLKYRSVMSGLYIPIRWMSTNTGATTYYTLPGAKMVNNIPLYKEGSTLGLENALYTCIENPMFYTKINASDVKIEEIDQRAGGKRNFSTMRGSSIGGSKNISLIITPKDNKVTGLLDEHYIDSTGSIVTTASTLFKVSHDNLNEYWEKSNDTTITADTADVTILTPLQLNTLMADIGTTVFVKKDKSVYIRKRESSATFPRTVSSAITKKIKTTGLAIFMTSSKAKLKLTETLVAYFVDTDGNYYIQDTRKSITKTQFVYKESSVSLDNITYSTVDGHDSKATFTIISNYPLQYVRFEKREGEITSTNDYIEPSGVTEEFEGETYMRWDQYEWSQAQEKYVDSRKGYLFPLSGPRRETVSGKELYKPVACIRIDEDEGYGGGYDDDKVFDYEVRGENNELIRIYESNAVVYDNDKCFVVTDSPTKKYEIGYMLGTTYEKALESINVPYNTEDSISSQRDRRVRGRMYSELYDIDIHVRPEVDSTDKKPYFEIESISERALTTGEFEYTITLLPTKDFEQEGKRFCGQVIVSSRIRNILSASRYVPSDITNVYPRVLPLYENRRQITNQTRPPKGISWEESNKSVVAKSGSDKDADRYEYELVILPATQKKIEEIVPSAEVVVDIYQQQDNYIQLYGDRTREVYSGETRRFSTLYEPGEMYPIKRDSMTGEVTESLKLSSETIRLKCSDTGWSGRETTNTFIAEVNDIDTLIRHIPVLSGDIFEVVVKDSSTKYYYLYDGITKSWLRISNENSGKLSSYDIEIDNAFCDEHKKGMVYTKKSSQNLKALGKLNSLNAGDIYKVTPHEYAREISPYYECRPSESTKEIQTQVNNYDPAAANKAGQPFALLYFNNIFASYYPVKINSDNIQSGKIISKFKSGSTRDNLVNFTIELGKWNISNGIATVDELDYFTKGDENEIKDGYYVNLFDFDSIDNKVSTSSYNPDKLYYVRWYKMEQSGNGYQKLDFYRLLLPRGIDAVNVDGGYNGVEIDGMRVSLTYDSDESHKSLYDVNGISLNYPLPQKYYYTEMTDNDTSVNYFTDMRGKMLVQFKNNRLFGTSANSLKYWWKTLVPRVYQECISFMQPGINHGLVCATSSMSPKLFLSDSGKNTIYEQVSGNSTFLDIMAGVFNLTTEGENSESIDYGDKFHKEGTHEMPSTSVADRGEWFERAYYDAERTSEKIETINGIRYSVWDKYEEGHKFSGFSILINKKYDNLVKVGEETVKYISLLNIEDPDSELKTLWPDYTMTNDEDEWEDNYFDFRSEGEPLVDYRVGEDGIERLYHSGMIAYDKWVKYENGRKYPGYYVLMDRRTNYSSISLRKPRRAAYTVMSDKDSDDNYFNTRGDIFVKYEYSHGDYIERSDEIVEIDGVNYTKWYKYVYNEKLNKFEQYNLICYLFKSSTGPVRKTTIEGNLYEADYTIYVDSEEVYEEGSKLFDKEFLDSNNQIYKIYEVGAILDEYLYKTNSDEFSATGTADLNISCADSITKVWSYEVLKDKCFVDFDGSYKNNIRINFPSNTSENDVTRRFRIETKDDAGGIKHSAILQIVQSSFLGNIYCDNTAYFMADGSYLGRYTGQEIDGEKEVDRYFYFDTDIPSSELEFTISDDPEATVILSMGEDTNSSYGTDFKKYRLSINLGKNVSRERKTRILTMTRYYSVYDDGTGTLVKKFKIIKTVKLVQGYQALYIRNPLYVQKWLNKKLNTDNPIPEFLSTGGIVGSFNDPLIVPYDQYIALDEITGMNYTIPLYYEQDEPSLEDDGDFILKRYDRQETLAILGDEPITRQKWNIQSPKAVPSKIFEEVDNPARFGVSVVQEQEGLKTPCLVYRYDTKNAYLTTNVLSYIEVTITLVNGNTYNFYVYMKKSNKQ